MTASGNLMEIFSSFQGEGIHAGVRQIFIRLGQCHMRCVYCDTPQSWEQARSWRIEREPHSGEFETGDNPVSVDRILSAVDRYLAGRLAYHSVSITGGEPLLQTGFLVELLPEIRKRRPVYLETSGTLSDRLEKVAAWVDVFALDIKPLSTPGVTADPADIRRCLEIARGRGFVKIVVMRDSPTDDEILSSVALIRSVDPRMPLVLTPVTPVNPAAIAPSPERLCQLKARCSGLTVLVVPQIHHLAGWI